MRKGKRMPDWYCKLFICAEMPEKELLDLINLHLHGIKQGIRTIRDRKSTRLNSSH